MGNLHCRDLDCCDCFDKEKSVRSEGDASRESALDVKGTYFMTEVEHRQMKAAYEMIYPGGDSTPSREGLKTALRHEENELLLRAMLEWLRAKNVRDFEHFQSVIIYAARVSSGRTIESLWEVAKHGRAEGEDAKTPTLFLFCRLALLIISDRRHTADVAELNRAARMLQDFLVSSAHRVNPEASIATNLDRFVAVVHEFAPHIAKAFHTYLSVRFLLASDNPSFKPYISPTLSVPTETTTQLTLNALALYREELQSHWERLYSTSMDGLSFNRLAHHIEGYDGPICMIIKCSNPPGSVFGCLTFERWKELNRFFGSPKSLLFTLSPELRIFRSKTPGNGAYQWLNCKAYNYPHGLGLGGTLEKDGFRVFIPDSLENCVARDSCPTYEDGKLISNGEVFQIDTLEMWGCGGQSRVQIGLKAQQENRKVIDESLSKARKVDKAAFFDSSFDREFLLSNTFSHDKEKQERLEEY